MNAGPDRAVRSLSDVITLAGSATDDGWPRNSTLQYSWQTKYGPGTVTFGDVSSAVTSASFSERGLYILELSASDSQYTSRDLVEVRVDMICSANPPGAVAWWPANYVGTETVSGNTAVLEGGVAYGAGKVGGAFTFDGIDGRVKVDAHPSLDIGAGNSLTIEFWMNSADVSRSVRLLGWHSDLDVFSPDHGVNIFQSGGELHVQVYDTNNAPHEFAALGVLTNNTWTHVAVTYDRPSGQGRIFLNGALRIVSNLGNFRPRTTFPLFFGHLLSDSSYFEGALDEVTLYPRALDAQEIYEIYSANGTGKCPISSNLPPLVNAGPDIYLQAPGVATLNGSATDDGQPAPGSLRAAWSVVSGPGTATFGDSTALVTTANFDSAGIYVLRLSVDDAATVRSDVVEVRVASVCTIKNIPGLAAWFTGNGHALDVVGGRQAQLAAGLSFANGRVASAFSFDGVNDSARVPSDPGLDIGAGAGFSLEFWVNSADVTRTARLVGYHNGLSQNGTNIGVNIFQQSGNIHAQIPDPTGNPHEFVAGAVLTANTWTHVVVTYDRTRGIGRTYINGAQRIASNVGSYLARTVGNLHFGNVPFDVNYFRGLLDEVSVYNRTLDAQEVYELFSAGGVGKCPNDLNQGPVVNAGADVFLRDTAQVANLNGVVTDDGLPPGYGVNSLWSVVDGPGIVSFANPATPLTTATFNAPGIYVLRLSADDGLISSSDLVEVRVGSLCTVKDVPGLVAWWPANGNGNDVVGVNHARLGGGVAFATGRVSAGFRFDGTNDAVQVAAHPSLDVGQGNGLSLEFWMNSLDVTRFTRVVGWHFGMGAVATNFGVNVYQQSGGVSAQIYDLSGTPHELGAANSLTNGVWTHVAVTYDRTTGLGRIYVNGGLRTTAPLGIYQPRTGYNLYFGNIPSDTGFFRGMLDEVSLYNRPLDAQEVYDIYNSGPVGKCPKDQNQAPVVNAGRNVTLAGVSDVAMLNGSVSDDGLPAGAGVRSVWSKLDGPGTVTFGDPTAPVTSALFSAPGIYVLNLAADDSAVLRNDVMEVRVAMPCSAAPAGLVAWWPGNGTAQEVVGGRDGRLAGGTAFASGRVSTAFTLDGINDAVHVAANPALDVGLGSGLTLEFWVNPTDITRSGRMVSWHSGLAGSATNFGVGVQMLGRTVNAQLYDVAGNSRDVNAANALTNNVWTHVAVTYDRTAGQGRVYINGALRTTVTVGTNTPRTNYKLYFGNVPFDPNFFRGLLDEISIYDHALTSNEVAAVYAAGAAGKCPPAPVGPSFAMEMSASAPSASVIVDEQGRRTAMTDGSGSTSYTYDPQGRLSRINKSWVAHAGAPAVETTLVYDYDELGRFMGVHSTMLNGAAMSYRWTEANQLTEVVDPHSGSTVYHYDTAGKPVGYTYPDGVTGSRFGVLDNVTCSDEPDAVCDADGYRVRRTVTEGSRTVTTYYVVSPFTVTGAAQVVEELTFDSADPLFATPVVTRVFVHGLHTISHEELESGAWELYFYE
ncbi:MAG TPA: LamG-like jellyroll fold domain-containing protein [Verrucomicrobiae bacterium]|nr:LamG-like jellyroll fold domain-containing protein [Verrucomicrobiae bacterium]